MLCVSVAAVTRGVWLSTIGRSLVCRERVGVTDAILVENFDINYQVFERAAALQRAGLASRILVPAQASRDDPGFANPISRDIAELMADHARAPGVEIIPIKEIEPYTLNAAYQIRDFLVREHLRSVLVVVPALRSERSSLVYRAVLTPAGIDVGCAPVVGDHSPDNWTSSWHGIQAVTEQFIKLQYYRFHVLRGARHPAGDDAAGQPSRAARS